MNTPVSFEVAKLLKEKNYKGRTLNYYFEGGEPAENKLRGTNGYYGEEYEHELEEFLGDWNEGLTRKNGDRCFGCNKANGYLETFSAPTIAEVVIWLYEKHGIWISVSFANKNQWYFNADKFGFSGKEKKIFLSNYDFNSPTEAYEAAFKYLLENMIGNGN